MLAAGLLLLATPSACKKGGASSAGSATGSASAAQAPKPPAGGAALGDHVRRMAAARKANKCATWYKCPGYKRATAMILVKGAGAPVLGALVALLADAQRGVRQAAGYLLYATASTSSIWHLARAASKGKASIDAALADKLIAGLGRLEGYPATRAAMTAAWIAALTDKVAALEKVMLEHKNKYVARVALKNLMTYGRLKVFARIQEHAKSKDAAIAAAALEAPRNMYGWSDAERGAICPWAMQYLGHASSEVAAQAGYLMVHASCKRDDKYVLALLAEGRRRVKKGSWDATFDFPFRDVCFGGFFGSDRKAKQALCAKNYKFLRSVADNPKIANNLRARALGWIAYQRRDRGAYELLQKYKSHKVKALKAVALRWIASIKRRLEAERKRKERKAREKAKKAKK